MTQTRRLSAFQLFSLCAMASMLGLSVGLTGALSAAHLWIAAAVFALQAGSVALLSSAFSRTSYSGFAKLTARLLSAPLARIILAALSLLFVLRASITLYSQTNAVNRYLLEDTSGFAVMLVLLITAYFTMLPGIRRLSGVSTLLVLLLPVLLIIIVIPGIISMDWGELRVLYQISSDDLREAFIPAVVTASGTECALFFLGGSRSEPRAARGAVIAPAVCAGISIVLVSISIGTIGLGGVSSSAFPFVEASRQINSGGIELTERFDLPLITASLFASIAQLAIYTLCASQSLSEVFGSERTGAFALGLLPVELGAALAVQYAGLGAVIANICAWGIIGCVAILFPLLSAIAMAKYRKADE